MSLTPSAPKGWIPLGSHPAEYEMVTDRSVVRSGKASARIECLVETPSGFGTLMQTFSADAWLGRRVRLTGFVKAENALGGGLWMRVDGKSQEALAFDNMSARGGIQGTHDWHPYHVVLDVPENAAKINLGLILVQGTLWMDDLKFETVGKDVPVTDMQPASRRAPENLDFEDL